MSNGDSYIGRRIGNYHVIDKIGGGTFGSVYRAQHSILSGRVIAIKLLHATYLSSQQESEKFLQEARLLGRLKHAHILSIIDVGIQDGFPYIMTEYAPNGSLKDRIRRQSSQPLSIDEAVTIITQIGRALENAYQNNVIHRDLKPENILFNAQGSALLADFGLSIVLDSASFKQVDPGGTPAYMAPEQFEGIASKQTDQYGLGCIAYELVTGRKPFAASTVETWWYQHKHVEPIPPRQLNFQLPEHFEQAILKAMAKKREERYSDVSEFIAALQTAPPDGVERKPTQPLLGTSATIIAPNLPDSHKPVGEQHGHNSVEAAKKEPIGTVSGQSGIGPVPVVSPQIAREAPMHGSYSQANPRPQAAHPMKMEDKTEPSLPAVPLPPQTNGKVPIPPSNIVPAKIPPIPPVNAPTRQGSPMKMAAGSGGATGSGMGVAMAGAGTPPSVPASAMAPDTGGRGPRRRRRLSPLLLLLLLLLAALVCVGGLAFASPISAPFRQAVSNITGGTSPTTVTITPKSPTEANSYNVLAVTGKLDPTAWQVQARQIAYTTPSQSNSTTATGKGTIPTTQATGTITFSNGSFTSAQTIPAGTSIAGKDGIVVITDATVTVPAASSGVEGQQSVSAHAANAGTSGNIAAQDINKAISSVVLAENLQAFTGGQDTQHFTFIQQGDLDKIETPLIAAILQSALTTFQSKIQPNERLVFPPICNVNVTTDHAVGDHAFSVKATATATCSGETYDFQGAKALGMKLLTEQVAKDATLAGYALVPSILTDVAVTGSPNDNGSVPLKVSARGIWAYQFSDPTTLAKQFAGKIVTEVQNSLAVGASSVKIDNPPSGGTFPADLTLIKVIVLPVAGLQASPTPASSPSPAPTVPRGTPITPPPGGSGAGGGS